MARNGYIREDLARQYQAAPVRMARPAVTKTEAPSAGFPAVSRKGSAPTWRSEPHRPPMG
jgi:hypothetical protein